jgi:hypothetical protein
MADPFQPKFVDLVRNYSTTVGTGNFLLGPAVNGYTSFTAACAVGDSFYYAALGVDKPAEREVGRGTLLSGGAISRAPIGGATTNFTSGTKSIALIAAAEWFNSVQAAAAAPDVVATPASCAELAATDTSSAIATLTQGGREGTFVFDSSDLSAKVSGDKAQAIYVAPASDLSGASGAWVRKFSGPVDPAWFGVATANTGEANSDALDAMVACLSARAVNVSGGTGGIERIRFGVGSFNLARTIEVAAGTMTWEGTGSGMASAQQTLLQFPTGVTGFRIQTYTTSGASTKDSVTHASGQGSVIRGFALRGAYAATLTEKEAHGVHLRARATVEDVYIQQFEGDGIYIVASSANGENANEWAVNRAFINNCRNGMYLAGSDSNAGVSNLVDAENCRQFGIYDTSFLGNTHIAPSSAGCGIRLENDGVKCPATVVSYNGNRYGCIIGQETGASVNTPTGTATDNSWWYFLGAGGAATGRPAWVSGMSVRAGGSYCADDSSGATVWLGAYHELAQGKAQFMSGLTPTQALVLGGTLSTSGNVRGGVVLQSALGTLQAGAATFAAPGSTGKTDIQPVSGQFLRFYDSTQLPSRMSYVLNGGDVLLQYASSANAILRHTGPNTTNQFGTGAAFPYATYASSLMVGDTLANGRQLTNSSGAPPAAGTFGIGAWSLDRSTSPGLIGWKCTAAGSPGTWQPMYSGYGAGQIGYATGAGGTVVQATSKATAVTLNKLCGQITTSAAALAANAAISFTLSNSQIAADDEVRVWVKTGNATAATYRAWSEGNAAGSRQIVLQNISAGSLSEPLVLGFAVMKAAIA